MLQTPYEITGNLTGVEAGDAFLHDLASDTNATLNHIGNGTMDDPLYTVTVGTGSAKVAVISSVHGNEPSCREATYGFLRDMAYAATPTTAALSSQYCWTFLPTANPSGIRNGWRRPTDEPGGIDINRDYANQILPESQAIAVWLSGTTPTLVIDLHEHLGTTTTEQIATGRQTHTGTHPDIRALSDQLNQAVATRVQADGYSWSQYPDSLTQGTARTEVGRLYKSVCILGESDRTIDLATRVGVNLSLLDESARFWMDHVADFESAQDTANNPSHTGLYYTDGSPVIISQGRLYYSNGAPVQAGDTP